MIAARRAERLADQVVEQGGSGLSGIDGGMVEEMMISATGSVDLRNGLSGPLWWAHWIIFLYLLSFIYKACESLDL